VRSKAYSAANLDKEKVRLRAYYTSNQAMVKATAKAWVVTNPGRHRANNKTWKDANRDKVRAENRAYSARNKDKIAAKGRAWRTANPDKANTNTAKRRATKLQATPAWADKLLIAEMYKLAHQRTKETGFEWHVDHIVPLRSTIVCGLHWELNLAVITKTANLSKSNRRWPDMP